jgi:hypothetical protein
MDHPDKIHGATPSFLSTLLPARTAVIPPRAGPAAVPAVPAVSRHAKLCAECLFDPHNITDIADILGALCSCADEIVASTAARQSGKIGRTDVYVADEELTRRAAAFVEIDLGL